MSQPDYKSLSRGISRDMSSEAIARRLKIVADLYELAKTLSGSKNLGRVEELRQNLQLGLEQLDRGECVELDDESLGTFLDQIEDEVNRELTPRTTEGQ